MASFPPELLDTLPYADLAPAQKLRRLWSITQVFLKLGTIAFGGPAAHIAMMDDEVVNYRGWLTRERFLDLLGITSLIPGPSSTQLAIYVGYERAGFWGVVLAGTSFILPAMLMVWGLAALYVQYQTLPQLNWLLYGIKPVIIVIVLQALWKLGQKAIKDQWTAAAALTVTLAFALGSNGLLLLVLAGVGVILLNHGRARNNAKIPWVLFPSSALLGSTPTAAVSVTWVKVFLFFLKLGSVLYGGGYVLLAFLQQELVERAQWLTTQQLLDAVSIGQITPGPVFTTATFVGYLLAGNAGAIAGTIGIFLPSFILVLVISPWVSKLRSLVWVSHFLDGVNAASIGLMAVVTLTLGHAAIIDWLTLCLMIASGIALMGLKLNSVWLMMAGGAIGIIAKAMGR